MSEPVPGVVSARMDWQSAGVRVDRFVDRRGYLVGYPHTPHWLYLRTDGTWGGWVGRAACSFRSREEAKRLLWNSPYPRPWWPDFVEEAI